MKDWKPTEVATPPRAPVPLQPLPPALLLAARAALTPLALLQFSSFRRRLPPWRPPAGPGQGSEGSGPVRLRVLVVGDGTAVGTGTSDAGQGLAPLLARALLPVVAQSLLGAGSVTWQQVGKPGLDAERLLAQMASTRLEPADVLITTVGLHDVLQRTPPARWLRALDAIRSHARHRAKVMHTVHCAPPRLDLMPVLPQPLRWFLGTHASQLDTALRRHVRHSPRRSRFIVPFDPAHDSPAEWLDADGLHPNAALYLHWAQTLAEHINHDLTKDLLSGAKLPSHYAGLEDSSFSGWGGLR